MSDPTALYIWTKEQMALDDALRAAEYLVGGAPVVGLFYSPRWCRIGLYRDGAFKDENDAPLELTHVFEGRIFSERGELRWWNDPATGFGRGKAAYLSEINRSPEGWPHPPVGREDLFPCPNQYLLWGEGWKPKKRTLVAGWSCLATGRIGTLMVPFPDLPPKERLQLTTIEYLGLDPGEAGQHGNVVVIEERLLKLEKYEQPQQKEGPQQKEESHE